MRIYAIGDVHGHLDKLREVHRQIARDQVDQGGGGETIVHCGDFVDRGPDARGVIDFLIDGQAAGRPFVTLLGNHDLMMLQFLRSDPGSKRFKDLQFWLRPKVGGRQTLASYGVTASPLRLARRIWADAVAAVPQAHIDFLERLTAPHVEAGCFFCHAGVRPGLPLEAQSLDDLIWIREPFLSDLSDHGMLIVHGHTPVEEVTHYGNRLDIDTGAGFGRALSAVVIEDDAVFRLTSDGRVPVRPVPLGWAMT